MTAVGPAQRLLAELMGSEPLSAEPIAEVSADLAALGIDPADSIAATRRLAEGMDSPAAALLDRIEESDQIDAHSGDLLSADITTVYAQTDEEVAKATIENARRMARSNAKIVPIRRRAFRIVCIVGALAAGLALFTWVKLSGPTPARMANVPTVVALLIVDPELAPPSLKEARLPAGDLAQRLAEARTRAQGLSVIALLSIRQPSGDVADSAIVAGFDLRGAGASTRQEQPQGPTAIALQKLAGPLPADLVVIDLPAE